MLKRCGGFDERCADRVFAGVFDRERCAAAGEQGAFERSLIWCLERYVDFRARYRLEAGLASQPLEDAGLSDGGMRWWRW